MLRLFVLGLIFLLRFRVFRAQDDEKSGILTNDPFLTADVYLPLRDNDVHVPGMLHSAVNLATGKKVVLIKGAQTYKGYASTMKRGSYICVTDKFADTCYSNPVACKKGTMTISMWVYLNSTESFETNSSRYVMSLGGQSAHSRGFAFLYQPACQEFLFTISSRQFKWSLPIKLNHCPTEKWVNLAFTWVKGVDGKLTYYVDGKEKMRIAAEPLNNFRPKGNNSILMLSRPNNVKKDVKAVEHEYPMLVKDVAFWDTKLTDGEVERIYKLIDEVNLRDGIYERKVNTDDTPTANILDLKTLAGKPSSGRPQVKQQQKQLQEKDNQQQEHPPQNQQQQAQNQQQQQPQEQQEKQPNIQQEQAQQADEQPDQEHQQQPGPEGAT